MGTSTISGCLSIVELAIWGLRLLDSKPLRITTLTVLLMSAWAELNCSTAYVALQKCHEHHVPSSCVNRIRILHKMTLLIWQNTLAKYKLFHSSQPATATGICASTKVLSPIRKILEQIGDIDVSFLTTRPCTLDSSSNRMLPPWLASKTLGWYSGTGLKKDRCAALASSFFVQSCELFDGWIQEVCKQYCKDDLLCQKTRGMTSNVKIVVGALQKPSESNSSSNRIAQEHREKAS